VRINEGEMSYPDGEDGIKTEKAGPSFEINGVEYRESESVLVRGDRKDEDGGINKNKRVSFNDEVILNSSEEVKQEVTKSPASAVGAAQEAAQAGVREAGQIIEQTTDILRSAASYAQEAALKVVNGEEDKAGETVFEGDEGKTEESLVEIEKSEDKEVLKATGTEAVEKIEKANTEFQAMKEVKGGKSVFKRRLGASIGFKVSEKEKEETLGKLNERGEEVSKEELEGVLEKGRKEGISDRETLEALNEGVSVERLNKLYDKASEEGIDLGKELHPSKARGGKKLRIPLIGGVFFGLGGKSRKGDITLKEGIEASEAGEEKGLSLKESISEYKKEKSVWKTLVAKIAKEELAVKEKEGSEEETAEKSGEDKVGEESAKTEEGKADAEKADAAKTVEPAEEEAEPLTTRAVAEQTIEEFKKTQAEENPQNNPIDAVTIGVKTMQKMFKAIDEEAAAKEADRAEGEAIEEERGKEEIELSGEEKEIFESAKAAAVEASGKMKNLSEKDKKAISSARNMEELKESISNIGGGKKAIFRALLMAIVSKEEKKGTFGQMMKKAMILGKAKEEMFVAIYGKGFKGTIGRMFASLFFMTKMTPSERAAFKKANSTTQLKALVNKLENKRGLFGKVFGKALIAKLKKIIAKAEAEEKGGESGGEKEGGKEEEKGDKSDGEDGYGGHDKQVVDNLAAQTGQSREEVVAYLDKAKEEANKKDAENGLPEGTTFNQQMSDLKEFLASGGQITNCATDALSQTLGGVSEGLLALQALSIELERETSAKKRA
jgi:hypothetical protein